MHQRGVNRQARQHLASLGRFKKLRALVQHVAIDGIAQVCSDAFAQPAHHVKAPGREQAQRHRHAKQGHKVIAQAHQLHAFVAQISFYQPAVNQAAQGQRESQRGQGSQYEEGDGQPNAATVRAQKRQQTTE